MMSTPDMSPPRRAATDHEPLWQVSTLPGTGTMVQKSPQIYPVVWPNDPYAAQIAPYLTWLVGSDYWTGSLGEYGIGKGSNMGVVMMPTPSPSQITDTDFNDMINTLVSNGTIASPSLDTNVVFFIPPTTTVTSMGETSCTFFGGYHSTTTGNPSLVYSVVTECLPDEGGSRFDTLTKAAAHELAEAASNPIYGKGYKGPQGLTEVGDLCNFGHSIAFDVPGDATNPPRRYTVQRLYSFAAAKLENTDPCLPVPFSRPFFGVTTKPTSVTVNVPKRPGPGLYPVETVLQPFAYGDVGALHWQVINSDVDIQPLQGVVMPGDDVHLTANVPGGTVAANQATILEVDFEVESEKAGTFTWPFFIDICPYMMDCSQTFN
jgi:hypothetical protein